MTGLWLALAVVLALGLLALALRWAANDPGKEEGATTVPAAVPRDPWEAVEEEAPVEPAADAARWIEVLRSGEPGPCREAVAQLVAIGEPALGLLEEAARDEDPDLRFDVRRAMRLIRGDLPG